MTLVEVMLVMFIIGLASTVVVMTLPPQDSPARRMANELARTLQTAQDRAILTGSSVGVTLRDKSVGTAIWRRNAWQADSQTLQIPRAVNLRLLDNASDDRVMDVPTIIFDATGVNPDLSFRIDGRLEDIDLTFTAAGEVQIEAR